MGIDVLTSQGEGVGMGRTYHDRHINVCPKVILLKLSRILIKREIMISIKTIIMLLTKLRYAQKVLADMCFVFVCVLL